MGFILLSPCFWSSPPPPSSPLHHHHHPSTTTTVLLRPGTTRSVTTKNSPSATRPSGSYHFLLPFHQIYNPCLLQVRSATIGRSTTIRGRQPPATIQDHRPRPRAAASSLALFRCALHITLMACPLLLSDLVVVSHEHLMKALKQMQIKFG